MALKPFIMPQSKIGADHAPAEWRGYWAGIEKKTAAVVSPLGAAPTNAQIATAFNALLTALQAVGLMKET